ncbi:hypothetical protein BT96DRAFT_169234 [Gymnopus androsaceus JB14]|uniref:Uncharacterized protein n=1 Tax=Gymnopus androsaceus JB14 TaxID=1447944 RepID=A0A6A4HAU4_9AGAR|nr:hypothetical protein BT96DRAFT_169234 [Gymnopus androsaceus JB14]
MATQRQAPLQPQICSVFSSSQNLPRSKPLLLLEQVYKPAEEENQVPWIIDPTMGLKNRRSITLLASVFLPSHSEDSDSSMEISESPTSISPPRQRSLSSTSVFYDDLESSNIDVLSVSTASASIAETSFLDSDPFADLTASPVETMAPLPPSVAATPKSPLSPSTDHFPSPRQTLAHSPVRPAHQEACFQELSILTLSFNIGEYAC